MTVDVGLLSEAAACLVCHSSVLRASISFLISCSLAARGSWLTTGRFFILRALGDAVIDKDIQSHSIVAMTTSVMSQQSLRK